MGLLDQLLTVAFIFFSWYNGTMSSHEGDNEILESERIEALRLILEREQGKSISSEEAQEVGESLISFYEALADGADELINQDQVLQNAVQG
jgi:hypothetical protein